jgi:hypothetical protein
VYTKKRVFGLALLFIFFINFQSFENENCFFMTSLLVRKQKPEYSFDADNRGIEGRKRICAPILVLRAKEIADDDV